MYIGLHDLVSTNFALFGVWHTSSSEEVLWCCEWTCPFVHPLRIVEYSFGTENLFKVFWYVYYQCIWTWIWCIGIPNWFTVYLQRENVVKLYNKYMCFDFFVYPDLYHLAGDPVRESDGYRMHSSFSQQLLKDHIDSSQQPEHSLIQVGKQVFRNNKLGQWIVLSKIGWPRSKIIVTSLFSVGINRSDL